MLILSRKPGESIVIDGGIKVTVIRIDGEAVKVGIEAPAKVAVHRQEVYDEIQRSNQQAIMRNSVALPKLASAVKQNPAGALRGPAASKTSCPT